MAGKGAVKAAANGVAKGILGSAFALPPADGFPRVLPDHSNDKLRLHNAQRVTQVLATKPEGKETTKPARKSTTKAATKLTTKPTTRPSMQPVTVQVLRKAGRDR